MKERITDEVNSATNKLQNIQILDQVATSIGQQIMSNSNDSHFTNQGQSIPQPLPKLTNETLSNATNHQEISKRKQPQLQDNNLTADENPDDLDSDFSPQHQLFNEGSIRRLHESNTNEQEHLDTDKTVIYLDELNSDLDDDVEIDLLDGPCEEGASTCGLSSPSDAVKSHIITSNISNYKARYKNLVHAIRKFNRDQREEKTQLENQVRDLDNQLHLIRKELTQLKQSYAGNSNPMTLSASSSQSDNIDKTILSDGRASPQQASTASTSGKQGRKIKDLEKLLAKCKESLKAKNSQLQILKDSLVKVDKFQGMMDEVKYDLQDLKRSYETWTVSIAENKRVMHQEIETKVSELEKYKYEVKEQNTKMNHLKSNIQNLESRLVSTSAAHQKERESLIKEMNAARNNALKQQQREHELLTERIKLDLEKSIEALKSELLNKDEQIIRSAENQQKLYEQNQQYAKDLTNAREKLHDTLEDFEKIKSQTIHQNQEISNLKTELEQFKNAKETDQNLVLSIKNLENELESYKKKCSEANRKYSSLESRCQEYEQETTKLKEDATMKLDELERLRCKLIEETAKNSNLQEMNSSLNEQVAQLTRRIEENEQESIKLRQELDDERASAKQKEPNSCENCSGLDEKAKIAAEKYEQTLHELNTRIDLMTTANSDQERALGELERKYEGAMASLQSLKLDLDESVKKNESLIQVIQNNEVEIQQQQDYIDQLTIVKQEIENLKRDNSTLTTNLNQLRQDLNERNSDLNQSRKENEELGKKLLDVEGQLKLQVRSFETMKTERDSLNLELADELKRRNESDQQLVVSILSAIKNLETPDASPRSDKNFKKMPEQEKSTEDNGDWSQDEHSDSQSVQRNSLPDIVRLAEELSSLAMDRSSAYITATQRLQAVLLDNKMISDELRRLKEELNSLNHEKSQEVQFSLEEVERLRTENQALIHDQKAYDDQVASLEGEIESLTEQLNAAKLTKQQLEAGQANRAVGNINGGASVLEDEGQDDLEARYNELDDLLRSKEDEIKQLKEMLAEKSNLIEHQKQQLQPQQLQIQQLPTIQQHKIISEAYVPDSTEFEYLKNIGKSRSVTPVAYRLSLFKLILTLFFN